MAETGFGTFNARRRWVLAAAIVLWTSIAWGGRIGLLAGEEDLWAWTRIGGSVAIALIAAAALVSASLARWREWALGVFAGWTFLVWSRSLVVNWVGSGSLPFKLVHTVLAAGFFAIAWWAWNARRSVGRPSGVGQ